MPYRVCGTRAECGFPATGQELCPALLTSHDPTQHCVDVLISHATRQAPRLEAAANSFPLVHGRFTKTCQLGILGERAMCETQKVNLVITTCMARLCKLFNVLELCA